MRSIFQWSYETFDVTGPQMVLVMKLSTFAWNVQDGRRQVEKLDKWQKDFRVVEFPSILEFLGYAYVQPFWKLSSDLLMAGQILLPRNAHWTVPRVPSLSITRGRLIVPGHCA
jgi:hypothetical protein